MSLFWRRPAPPTLTGSSLVAANNDKLITLHIDALSEMIKHVGVEDPEGLLVYSSNKVRSAVASRNLGDIPNDKADTEPYFGEPLRTPKPGAAKARKWKNRFSIEDFNRVAWEVTRLTSDEKAKINCMDIDDLMNLVRTECPYGFQVIFASRMDAMNIEKLRAEVIDKLRLSYEELKMISYTGPKRDMKSPALDYMRVVRPQLIRSDHAL